MQNLCVALLPMAVMLFSSPLSEGLATATEPATPLRPEQDYTGERSKLVKYDVDFSVVVTPPYHAKVLNVWVPLPQSDAGQEIRDRRITTFPMQVEPEIATEPVYGNEFAYFEFHEPKGAQMIRHRFTAQVWEMSWDVNPERVSVPDAWPQSFGLYLRDVDGLAKRQDFRALLQEMGANNKPRTDALFASMNWIDNNLSYNHVNASLKASAEHAFDQRQGHCSDYHGLCATIGRSLGVPTRVAYGLNLFPKNSPSHCKLEAFLPPYGWVSFDLSETQKLLARIEESSELDSEQELRLKTLAWERLKRGFRDNTWLAVTRGTDYELVPKASQPVHVVRTIYAEADGEPLPDPDPANIEKRGFAWMTIHDYKPDRRVTYPFKDVSTLEEFDDRISDAE
jgi:transglutaminase-like putative cysteine protease